MTTRKLSLLATLVFAGGCLITAQFVGAAAPVNHPVIGDISAPPEIKSILKRSCYDCHSEETRWPWYGRVAPLSWSIASDVEAGRKEINFSKWSTYPPNVRIRKLEWIGRSLQGVMPPIKYLLLHPGARLTASERAQLRHWVETQIAASAASPQSTN